MAVFIFAMEKMKPLRCIVQKSVDKYFWDDTATEFTPTYGLVAIQPFPKPIELNAEDYF